MLTRMMNDFSPLLRLQDEMNRLFDGFFEETPASTRPYSARYPAMNLWEDGEAAYIESELPGMTEKELDIAVAGKEVTISGTRQFDEHKGASWHRRERSSGGFTRTMTLPWEIDADKVEAQLRDGVLTLKLPKCESCKPKKVKVLSA